MCASCGNGIPVCAANAACTASVQQAVATSAIIGSGLFAIAKDYLALHWNTLLSKMKNKTKKK